MRQGYDRRKRYLPRGDLFNPLVFCVDLRLVLLLRGRLAGGTAWRMGAAGRPRTQADCDDFRSDRSGGRAFGGCRGTGWVESMPSFSFFVPASLSLNCPDAGGADAADNLFRRWLRRGRGRFRADLVRQRNDCRWLFLLRRRRRWNGRFRADLVRQRNDCRWLFLLRRRRRWNGRFRADLVRQRNDCRWLFLLRRRRRWNGRFRADLVRQRERPSMAVPSAPALARHSAPGRRGRPYIRPG